jgi:hypothetical protein
MPMMEKTQDPDICIVVLSCDKYGDLWPLFFRLFFRFWPDCQYPVYLFANRQSYDGDSRVRTVLSGDDPDWSTSVMTCLRQLKHKHVWLFFDDEFLDKQIYPDKINRLSNFIADKNPSYLRFRKFPKPDKRISRYFGRCRENTLYRTSVFAIWKREVLLDLMHEGESAWDFERNSVSRSDKYPDFYGVYEEYLSYIHGVERGVWSRKAVEKIRRLGLEPDLARRPEMSLTQHRQFQKACLRTYIFNRAPSRLKPVLIKLAALSRRIIGYALG